MVVDSAPIIMTSPFSYVSSTRHDFLLVEWVLSLIREMLATATVFVPLLHPYGYLIMLVVAVVHTHHSWVGL